MGVLPATREMRRFVTAKLEQDRNVMMATLFLVGTMPLSTGRSRSSSGEREAFILLKAPSEAELLDELAAQVLEQNTRINPKTGKRESRWLRAPKERQKNLPQSRLVQAGSSGGSTVATAKHPDFAKMAAEARYKAGTIGIGMVSKAVNPEQDVLHPRYTAGEPAGEQDRARGQERTARPMAGSPVVLTPAKASTPLPERGSLTGSTWLGPETPLPPPSDTPRSERSDEPADAVDPP